MDGDKVVGNNQIISHPLGLPSNVDLTTSSPRILLQGGWRKTLYFFLLPVHSRERRCPFM